MWYLCSCGKAPGFFGQTSNVSLVCGRGASGKLGEFDSGRGFLPQLGGCFASRLAELDAERTIGSSLATWRCDSQLAGKDGSLDLMFWFRSHQGIQRLLISWQHIINGQLFVNVGSEIHSKQQQQRQQQQQLPFRTFFVTCLVGSF